VAVAVLGAARRVKSKVNGVSGPHSMRPCEVGLKGFLNLELHAWLKLASGIKPPDEFQIQGSFLWV